MDHDNRYQRISLLFFVAKFVPFFLWKILSIGWNHIFQVEIWRNFAKNNNTDTSMDKFWRQKNSLALNYSSNEMTRWGLNKGSSEVSIGAPPTCPDSITPVTILQDQHLRNEMTITRSQQGHPSKEPTTCPDSLRLKWESLSRNPWETRWQKRGLNRGPTYLPGFTDSCENLFEKHVKKWDDKTGSQYGQSQQGPHPAARTPHLCASLLSLSLSLRLLCRCCRTDFCLSLSFPHCWSHWCCCRNTRCVWLCDTDIPTHHFAFTGLLASFMMMMMMDMCSFSSQLVLWWETETPFFFFFLSFFLSGSL